MADNNFYKIDTCSLSNEPTVHTNEETIPLNSIDYHDNASSKNSIDDFECKSNCGLQPVLPINLSSSIPSVFFVKPCIVPSDNITSLTPRSSQQFHSTDNINLDINDSVNMHHQNQNQQQHYPHNHTTKSVNELINPYIPAQSNEFYQLVCNDSCQNFIPMSLIDDNGLCYTTLSPGKTIDLSGFLWRGNPPSIPAFETQETQSPKEKKIARVVMVVAVILLTMCVVLVAVTLSMSGYIDAMVRELHMKRHPNYAKILTSQLLSINNTTSNNNNTTMSRSPQFNSKSNVRNQSDEIDISYDDLDDNISP